MLEDYLLVLKHGGCDDWGLRDNRDVDVLDTSSDERALRRMANFIPGTKINYGPDAKRTEQGQVARGQLVEDIAAIDAATPNGSPIGGWQTTQTRKFTAPSSVSIRDASIVTR